MPPRKYKTVKEGEWVQPIMNGYRLSCCDCGLVHEINFRIIEKGKKIQLQAYRNQRSTSALRRNRTYSHNDKPPDITDECTKK